MSTFSSNQEYRMYLLYGSGFATRYDEVPAIDAMISVPSTYHHTVPNVQPPPPSTLREYIRDRTLYLLKKIHANTTVVIPRHANNISGYQFH